VGKERINERSVGNRNQGSGARRSRRRLEECHCETEKEAFVPGAEKKQCEKDFEVKGRTIFWIAFCCSLATCIGLALLLRASKSDFVTFRLIDKATGAPMTNVTVWESRRWTTLPLEHMGVPGLTSFRKTKTLSKTGETHLRVPTRQQHLAMFAAPGYMPVFFYRTNYDILRGGNEYKQMSKSNVVTVVFKVDPQTITNRNN
jgi:hypothetical protein